MEKLLDQSINCKKPLRIVHVESKTREASIASVAEQSFVRSLKPTMSPKKMVTQSKFSAETWIFDSTTFLSALKNLFELDVPDDGEREEVVEGFLRLHLLLVELLHLLDHLLCKNLRTRSIQF